MVLKINSVFSLYPTSFNTRLIKLQNQFFNNEIPYKQVVKHLFEVKSRTAISQKQLCEAHDYCSIPGN